MDAGHAAALQAADLLAARLAHGADLYLAAAMVCLQVSQGASTQVNQCLAPPAACCTRSAAWAQRAMVSVCTDHGCTSLSLLLDWRAWP